MKRLIIFFLGVLLVVCCAASGVCAAVAALSKQETAESANADVMPEIRENKEVVMTTEKEISAEAGDVLLLSPGELESDEKFLWSSSNESVAAVDDGGRVDLKSEGECTVTLKGDLKELSYKISVEKARKQSVNIFSTAVTANGDVLAKNKKDKSQALYRLFVNTGKNVVTVYTYDKKGKYTVPVRAMLCSCGKNDSTIKGEFSTYFQAEWHALYNNVYGQYVTGISGDFLFHSVPYTSFSRSSLETEEFNKLGTQASLGCVRLAVADAKWIYDNCPVGTYVKIYNSSEDEPLGKPEAIRISNHKIGWDPTERAYSSPYRDARPEIKGAENLTVKQGENLDLKKGVTALDTCGNDITEKLEITGNVIASRKGEYRVTYEVTDALNRTTRKNITVKVS